jgi:hypothetical protein
MTTGPTTRVVRTVSGRLEDGDHFAERCEDCAGETPHTVHIELKTESDKRENAAFSREPYRVATCGYCGATTSQRMNDA